MEGDFRVATWLVQPQINTMTGPANTPVLLEPKVMEVLTYLAAHAGEVVPKERLIQALWPDTHVTENVLTAAISDLRRVFDDDARNPKFIQTISKRGYRLIAPVSKLRVARARYEIVEKLGQGAMGEVFLARDNELHRKVALKFVLEDSGSDETGRNRLLREARATAALDHPFICKIFDVGETEGRTYIAMEYLQGQTLKEKLAKGRLEMKEALRIAAEIAEALEAAHGKGIIHRDLKPSNIMLAPEGHVKVMDFGLAKRVVQHEGSLSLEDISCALTGEGATAGTLPYMSPEQMRGETVDNRSDIFSLGIIVYEMLAGVHPFQKGSSIDTAAAILNDEPVSLLQRSPMLPALLSHVLKMMLAKEPASRYQVVRDFRLELADLSASGEAVATAAIPEGAANVPRRPSRIWLAACTAAAIVTGIAIDRVFTWYFQPASPSSVVTSTIKIEPGHWLYGMCMAEEMQRPSRTTMTISRDGRFLVYSAIVENPGLQARSQLYMRRIGQSDAKPIPGTEGGINPFLSPDDRWVGFWADGKLKKVPVEGGVPTVLCDVSLLFGANWGGDNSIVFADGWATGLTRISAEGGKTETLTRPDPKREESSHRLPSWLPNGKAVLFTAMRHGWDYQPWLALLRLDTREWHVLLQDAADARYVPTGHLVFLRQGTFMAVRFDLDSLEVIGQPVALVGDVMQAFSINSGTHTGAGQFGISETGSLVYVAGGVVPDMKNSLVWVDQRGTEEPVTRLQFPYNAPRLSPDGRSIAYGTSGREWQIWVYDLSRGTNSRLTGDGRATYPIWTPDGKRLLFAWHKSGPQNLFWQPYDGSSPMERLTTSQYVQRASSWSSSGKTVALVQWHLDTGFDIAVLDADSGRVIPFLNSQFDERWPDFSPDGRWIAYVSDESGRREVYVRPFPGPGAKHQVSGEGGIEPLWARDGKGLFYRWQDQVWVVEVRTDGGLATSNRRLLFEQPGYLGSIPIRGYDLSLDGRRFLMVRLEQRKPTLVTEMTLVQNWFEELKRLCPSGK